MTNESGDDLKALCAALRCTGRFASESEREAAVRRKQERNQAADTIERLQADLERAVEVMTALVTFASDHGLEQEPGGLPVVSAAWQIVRSREEARSFIASRSDKPHGREEPGDG
jgi:hypothetical protein